MSRKRYIVSFLITMGATCGIYAQQQTVVDNRGKAVNVIIPDASETMAGYVDVDYIDDKFYNSGIQTGSRIHPLRMQQSQKTVWKSSIVRCAIYRM